MPVRISYQQASREPEHALWKGDHPCRDPRKIANTHLVCHKANGACHESGLPVGEIVGMCVGWHGTAITGREIFEELHARVGYGPQGSNAQTRAKDIVSMFLLCAVVLAFSNHF